jgi:chromosome partitioning protein
MTRAILVLADLCLVPIGASPAEVWATSDLRTLIDDAAKVRRVHARLIWTRFRAYTTLAQELSVEAEKALGLEAIKTTLGYRVAYAEALGQGRTAAEVHDSHAKEEVKALLIEVTRLLTKHST